MYRSNRTTCWVIVEHEIQHRELKAQLRTAKRLRSKFIMFIGEEEIKSNIITIKIMKNDEEKRVPFGELQNFFEEMKEVQ